MGNVGLSDALLGGANTALVKTVQCEAVPVCTAEVFRDLLQLAVKPTSP